MCLGSLALSVLMFALSATAPTAEPPAPEVAEAAITELQWTRAGPGSSIRVRALQPGPELGQAQAALQRAGDHLDVLRTLQPHVVWTRLQWRAGRIRVEGRAESSLYAGVALSLLRRLHPGYTSAGSGIQQLHNVPAGGWSWRLRVLLVPPTGKPGR
jgi:hypothetical protein